MVQFTEFSGQARLYRVLTYSLGDCEKRGLYKTVRRALISKVLSHVPEKNATVTKK